MEDQQPRRAHGRVQLHRHADLGGGAEHAAAFHPPQLALFNGHAAGQGRPHPGHRHQNALPHVGRAADDLQGFALPHVHGAHMQMVAVFMIAAGEHPAHHHAGKFLSQLLHTLHAGAGHHHPTFIGRVVQRHGHIFFQPIHGNLHDGIPPLSLSGTGAGSAGRLRRADACPKCRSAAWRCAPARCRRQSRNTFCCRCRTFPAPWGSPCRSPAPR